MTTPDPFSASPGSQDPESPHPTPSAARARRRRRGRINVPQDAQGRAALLSTLAQRAYPTYELFVYALLCGAIVGLGYFVDSQALLIFGILVAPLLAPWVGLLLATVTGSARFFFETLMALLISAALVFGIGVLAGFAARPFEPRTFNEAYLHSRLWWPDLVVLALGAVILTLSFIRSEEKPFLPSVMLAYEFFLPLGAGGFGLGAGLTNAWPHGLLVFLVHFAWAGMFGLLTLLALRFFPTTLPGLALSGGAALVAVVTLLVLMTGGNLTPPSAAVADAPLPTSTESLPAGSGGATQPGPSSTPVVETATASATIPPTPVPLTLEVTLPPTESPTVTLTIEPTPVYARIKASKGGGAVLREKPGGKGITVLDNFSIVQVLPDMQELSGYTWAHVVATVGGNQVEGWVVQLYLEVATPPPDWEPSSTPALTEAPTTTSTP